MAATAPKRKLSVLKRARQTEKKNLRNRAVRSTVKTVSKRVEAAIAGNDKEQVAKELRSAVKTISSAASKGVLHKNTASRKISRLSRLADKVIKAGAA